VPQASVEFEVADADAVQIIGRVEGEGLHAAATHIPSREDKPSLDCSPSGAIINISYAPTMHS
jgi:hypothetical protein